MEQSSLALASAINAQGVYHISWSGKPTEKVSVWIMVLYKAEYTMYSLRTFEFSFISPVHLSVMNLLLFAEMSAELSLGQRKEG